MRYTPAILFSILFLLLSSSCRKSPRQEVTQGQIRVNLKSEPDKLNPYMTTNAYASIINRLLHPSLLEFHPKTLELQGYLATSLPEQQLIDTGRLKGNYAFKYEIRKEVTWDDGTPVTGRDYAFAMKALYFQAIDAPLWRSYLSFIEDVIVNENNPRIFTVLTNTTYFKARGMTGVYPLPAHLYDPNGLLDDYSISQIKDPAFYEAELKENDAVQQWATEMNSPLRTRKPEGVHGCGPYRLADWTSDGRIILKKKDNWWGDALYDKNDLFAAVPREIVYEVTEDPNTVYNQMSEGLVDVVGNLDAPLFKRAQNELKDEFRTFTPLSTQYYYLSFNMLKAPLDDVRVRKALSLLVDRDKIIELLFAGQAQKIVGPILPTKPYYNNDLQPYAMNVDSAIVLLEAAGWIDTDGNGIRDKNLYGEQVELSLELLVASESSVFQDAAAIWRESAEQAGVELQPVAIEFSALRQKLKNRDFDVFGLAAGLELGLDDLYQQWHTDNIETGGNSSGFGNEESDKLIEIIRSNIPEEERNEAYLAIQEMIHEQQPFAFLCTPKSRIVVHRKYGNAFASGKYPGFFEHHYRISDEDK